MPTTVTRFEVGQPVVYDGRETRVSAIDIRISHGQVVERYFVDDWRTNVDVRHLSPVPAPRPGKNIIVTEFEALWANNCHIGMFSDKDLDSKIRDPWWRK